MVIQRIQSLLLLVSAGLMGGFPWIPFGHGYAPGGEELLLVGSNPMYLLMLILGYVACGLLLTDIFLFKNFKLQKSVLKVAMLVMAVIIGFVCYYNLAADTNGYDVIWTGGCYMLVGAFILGYLAFRRIRADERLIRSYDRLR